jgi:hypothetical protein
MTETEVDDDDDDIIDKNDDLFTSRGTSPLTSGNEDEEDDESDAGANHIVYDVDKEEPAESAQAELSAQTPCYYSIPLTLYSQLVLPKIGFLQSMYSSGGRPVSSISTTAESTCLSAQPPTARGRTGVMPSRQVVCVGTRRYAGVTRQ